MLDEAKQIASHTSLGRGRIRHSDSYQKRMERQAVKELDALKLVAMRKIYGPLTSAIELRSVPAPKKTSTRKPSEEWKKKDKAVRDKNKKNDRKAEDLKAMAIQHLDVLHRSAFARGLKSADGRLRITPEDNRWLDEYVETEAGYFSKFFDEVRKGALSPAQVDARLRLYARASNGTFESGRVAGSNLGQLIYWVLNPRKEHCKICTFLQTNSPYTAANLPAVPRSGEACLGFANCGCELSFVQASPVVVRAAKLKMKTKQQLVATINRMRGQQ
jgi:hypothetical protein